MDLHTQEKIFDRFYQGDRSHSMEGNGLGLPLVKKIVALHRGAVRVAAGPDREARLPCPCDPAADSLFFPAFTVQDDGIDRLFQIDHRRPVCIVHFITIQDRDAVRAVILVEFQFHGLILIRIAMEGKL